MTDEQLIERIRAGLNDEVTRLHPPADLLEQLRSAPAPRSRSVVRLPAGAGSAVAVSASVAVAAIVAVALVSFGHGRSALTGVRSGPAESLDHGRSSMSGEEGGPVETPAGARVLVAQLAVLRRPQTQADRLPAAIAALVSRSALIIPSGRVGFRIIPGLTRLAATVDIGSGALSSVDIYVVVGAPPKGHAEIVSTLAVAGPSSHRFLLSSVVGAAVASGDLIPSAVTTAGQVKVESRKTHISDSLTGHSGVWVGVVPDGVTRVEWTFGAPPRGLSPRKHSQHGGAPAVTVYPKIEHNIAVAKASGFNQLSSATWYGSDGRVIAR
jgi:hypothetical protein